MDWGDNATAVTGVSDLAFPPPNGNVPTGAGNMANHPLNLAHWPHNNTGGNGGNSANNSFEGAAGDAAAAEPEYYVSEEEPRWRFLVRRFSGPCVAVAASLVAFASPPAMVALPMSGALGFREAQLRCHVSQRRKSVLFRAS